MPKLLKYSALVKVKSLTFNDKARESSRSQLVLKPLQQATSLMCSSVGQKAYASKPGLKVDSATFLTMFSSDMVPVFVLFKFILSHLSPVKDRRNSNLISSSMGYMMWITSFLCLLSYI